MKFFICLTFVAAVASFAAAASTGATGATATNINQEAETEVQAPVQAQALTDLTRLRKAAAYGGSSYGASIPSPPCPKNYLFSCQPNLSPVPCAAPAPSYGSQGAYSAPVATYITPVRGNYGLPQAYTGAYVPQGLSYNNQYLQY